MRSHLVVLLLLVPVFGAVLGACGKEIGDSCVSDQDCSANGDRQCDLDPDLGGGSPGGYCTIQRFDYSTCPSEATCVQFFSGNFANRECDYDPKNPVDPAHPKGLCSLDEVCAVSEHCVPRSSEVRYCMRTCDSEGDCRDGYECRDIARMVAHGGQPVLAPGVLIDSRAPKFCAAAVP